MPKVAIKQWPLAIEVGSDFILEAALRSGVPYPHGCRTGECGACKTQVLSGEVALAPYDEAALSAGERASGLILVCRARARSDLQVAWLGEAATVALPTRRLRAQVTNVEAVTPCIRRIYVWPETRLRFAAGQYMRVRFGDLPARSYSMANHPDDEVLEFHIRLIPGGQVSSYLQSRLRVGEYIRLEGPFGQAHLRPDQQGPVVAVAGGSGLAPVKSIVRTALRSQPGRPVRLYFGARDEEDVYDGPELAALESQYPGLQVRIVLSAPTGPTHRPVGTLPELLMADFPAGNDVTFYVAGPPGMVEAVKALALSRGLPERMIHADPFVASGAEAPARSSLLRVIRSRLASPWSRMRAAAPSKKP